MSTLTREQLTEYIARARFSVDSHRHVVARAERAVQYAREDLDLATERLQGMMKLQARMDASGETSTCLGCVHLHVPPDRITAPARCTKSADAAVSVFGEPYRCPLDKHEDPT